MGMGVCIERPLLARVLRGDAMHAVVIGPSLSHSAVDTRGADRTGQLSIKGCEASVNGVRLVPGHCRRAWVSGDEVHVVIQRGNRIACDQQASPRLKSAGFLNVDTIEDGTTNNLCAS